MNIGNAFSIAKLVYGGVGAIASGTVGGMASLAVGSVMLVKKYIDGESHKLLESVQKSEGCAYIQLVECMAGVPTTYAVLHVSENGGISWRRPEKAGEALVFWHPDDTFRPSFCKNPLVKDPKTKLVGNPSPSGPSRICVNTKDCCRRPRT